MNDVSHPKHRKKSFFFKMMIVFILSCLAAVLIPNDRVSLRSAILGLIPSDADALIVFGNSVIDAKSNCDENPSSIANMIEIRLGRRVIDMSQAGQALDVALGNVGLLTAAGHRRDIVVPISLFHFNTSNSYPVWTALLFQLAAGGLEVNSFRARFQAGAYVSGIVPLSQKPFVYKGQSYPDYSKISATYFVKEKYRLTCPSKIGIDKTFIEANYWKAYLLPLVQKKYFKDLAKIQSLVARRGSRVTYVLLPIDIEDVESLNADLASALRERLAMVRYELDVAKVAYLDLTESLPAAEFADRFCACGHLDQNGRGLVADRISATLAGGR